MRYRRGVRQVKAEVTTGSIPGACFLVRGVSPTTRFEFGRQLPECEGPLIGRKLDLSVLTVGLRLTALAIRFRSVA